MINNNQMINKQVESERVAKHKNVQLDNMNKELDLEMKRIQIKHMYKEHRRENVRTAAIIFAALCTIGVAVVRAFF